MHSFFCAAQADSVDSQPRTPQAGFLDVQPLRLDFTSRGHALYCTSQAGFVELQLLRIAIAAGLRLFATMHSFAYCRLALLSCSYCG